MTKKDREQVEAVLDEIRSEFDFLDAVPGFELAWREGIEEAKERAARDE